MEDQNSETFLLANILQELKSKKELKHIFIFLFLWQISKHDINKFDFIISW